MPIWLYEVRPLYTAMILVVVIEIVSIIGLILARRLVIPRLHYHDGANDAVSGIEVFPFADEIQAGLGFSPHVVEVRSLDKEVGDEMQAAVTGKGKVARFSAGTEGDSDQLDSGFDGLRPERDHFHREIDLRLVGGKPVLFNEIASEFSKTITFGIALERQAKNNAETRVTKRSSVTYSVPEAQIHHLAEMQVVEVNVGIECRAS